MLVVSAENSISRGIAGRQIWLRCVRGAILAAPRHGVNNEKLRAQANVAAVLAMVKVGMPWRNLNFVT